MNVRAIILHIFEHMISNVNKKYLQKIMIFFFLQPGVCCRLSEYPLLSFYLTKWLNEHHEQN